MLLSNAAPIFHYYGQFAAAWYTQSGKLSSLDINNGICGTLSLALFTASLRYRSGEKKAAGAQASSVFAARERKIKLIVSLNLFTAGFLNYAGWEEFTSRRELNCRGSRTIPRCTQDFVRTFHTGGMPLPTPQPTPAACASPPRS